MRLIIYKLKKERKQTVITYLTDLYRFLYDNTETSGLT